MTRTCRYPYQQPVDAAPLVLHITSYMAHMAPLGYSAIALHRNEHAARHFAVWAYLSGISPHEVDEGMVQRFAKHGCRNRRGRHPRFAADYMARVRSFVRFLARTGAVPETPAPAAPQNATQQRIAAFQNWLKSRRGCSEETVRSYTYKLNTLLTLLGSDPSAYDAGLIRQTILDISCKWSRYHTRNLACTLRCYLRFLEELGECQPWLSHAVLPTANWHSTQLPRYLGPAKIEKMIATCNRATPSGLRNRAILLLLARLGLRAGDIVDMRLEDVEWEEGTLRVRGKGRQEVRLPLPQDVGDAMLDYLNAGRPRVRSDRIFLRSVPPYRPLVTPSAFSHMVRRALVRSGMSDAPYRGTHMLRHSAATNMLRAGATLETIGTVLRHRSVETTRLYAKVDIAMLRQVAQPWPGEASC